MKILYYDCFSGISGDMHLGALLDLGVEPEHLREQLGKLGLEGYEINIVRDQRKGITGTRAEVVVHSHQPGHQSDHQHGHPPGHPHHHHRNLEEISRIINNSSLDKAIKDRSLKMFKRLSEAEAKIHGIPVEDVHFHEVGAIDSIVDIVGAAICIEYLKPGRIMASEVELGGGFVECEHGTFPVPAPATAEILRGIPVRSDAARFELTTPTGALILACNVDEFAPLKGMRILKTGYGIGQKDLEIPNVLRAHIAEMRDEEDTGREKSWIIECNIDDMNPEMYGYVMDALFSLGADDVFITPIIMKKARPASKLSVLCTAGNKDELTEALLTQTTSLGVRSFEVDKTVLRREFTKVHTRYGEITVKTAIYKGQKLKSKPEYEECVRLAKEHNVPVQRIYQEILGLLNRDAE